MSTVGEVFRQHLRKLHQELGIPPDYAEHRGLPVQFEATASELVTIAQKSDGGLLQLTKTAAEAWRTLHAEATAAGIALIPLSAFRSVARQTDIIRAYLAAGRSISDLLTAVAAPGYSEHHTGRALDVGTVDCPNLTEDFTHTAAFAWLEGNAHTHGFHLSFRRDNPHGFVYEPWHWCWQT